MRQTLNTLIILAVSVALVMPSLALAHPDDPNDPNGGAHTHEVEPEPEPRYSYPERGRYRNWRDGDPVPAGYERVSRIRKGLVIGGASTLGAMWLISIGVGSIGSSLELNNSDPIDKDDWFPMFIPVLGPFISIATLETGELGTTFLVIDGLVQAGGLAMLILGIALPSVQLRPVGQLSGGVDLQVVPVANGKYTGFALNGSF